MVAITPDLLGPFATMFVALFVAELTDKDAILLLGLATRRDARTVFAAGSITFILTSAIIVLVGAVLLAYVPVFWVKLAGGGVMIGYALWELRGLIAERTIEQTRRRLGETSKTVGWRAFLSMVAALAALDLAGDATELLIIVFVAQYGNLLLVFLTASVSLTSATALETLIGNRLASVLSARRIRYLSIAIFLLLGALILGTSL